jgi:transglutaminase-like putative cysteine protease
MYLYIVSECQSLNMWARRSCGNAGKEGLTLEHFLKSTEIIDWDHPSVLAKAEELSKGSADAQQTARRCFEWVRDEIQHSFDFKRNPVTCRASEVLAAKTGYCYAKSHLLAALLRANAIPAGLCYQRLSIDDTGAPLSLHGLNAIHLPSFGWYRVDCRGNKVGVEARFTPPVERLAFRIMFSEERNFPQILTDPLPVVVTALRTYRTWDDLYKHLPDWTESSLPDCPLSV